MRTQVLSAANKLKKIREAYLKQLPAQFETIRTTYTELVQQFQAETLELLHRRVHTLRGSSASFGLTRLSAAMARGERLLKEALQPDHTMDEAWHQQWRECFARIELELPQPESPAAIDTRAVELVTAGNLDDSEREQKLVYLCEDDTYQRLTLATQIECFGFRVVSFGELDQLRSAVRNAPPDVLVMDMIFPDRPTGGADTIDLIHRVDGKDIPAVFISTSNTFASRLAAVRAGSSAYFVKPVNATELCATLSNLTAVDAPDPYRILIVDDDTHLTELYGTILQDAGMITLAVSNPLEVMDPLIEFKPDLILTDMYMPGCNGIELASTIRQIDQAFSIPIIFLSSETDLGKQFHAMRMGGDEFLTKPVTPENLISAVAGRAKRMKILRSSAVRDSMTSLFNHTATKEKLEAAVALAERHGSDVCFAMIDVDRFKQINDTYGHAMGDQVLISLARLLSQRVRKSDIVGRYGGEEFAIVLPDCNLDSAVQVLNQLRESFAALRFPAGAESFSSSFSCGIAAYSHCGDVEELCKVADRLLYQAKQRGRNCVVAPESNEGNTNDRPQA